MAHFVHTFAALFLHLIYITLFSGFFRILPKKVVFLFHYNGMKWEKTGLKWIFLGFNFGFFVVTLLCKSKRSKTN